MSEKNYASDYLSLQFYSIGGKWGYAIIRLQDSNKELKVRLVKAKKLDDFPATKKYTWEEVPVEYIKNLSQVQKINFKPTDNFQIIANKILEELDKIKQLKEDREREAESSEPPE
ncbi:hypothetical protein DRO91_01730 [Candidatus Heimdallarchaeota archaeon]|nr:MAG: hypothetical protein DRP02_07990 [Candidatus Gerdarchaeota archaeon]RLI73966.1 MAG: hypothetical protein DRO91_01730 [Candidatus Heimdallarchaeota archaeon]